MVRRTDGRAVSLHSMSVELISVDLPWIASSQVMYFSHASSTRSFELRVVSASSRGEMRASSRPPASSWAFT